MSDIVDQLRDASLAFREDWRLLRGAADEIDRLRAERRWIPVTERLPAVNEYVLGCGKGWRTAAIAWIERRLWEEGQPIAWTCGEELDRGDTPKITHWMPLPPPPGEGEVGE